MTFVIQEKDIWGNDRHVSTEATVSAYFVDGFADVTAKKNTNGSWTCTYMMTDLTTVTERFLHVKINGVSIRDSPFEVHVLEYTGGSGDSRVAIGFVCVLGLGAGFYYFRRQNSATNQSPQSGFADPEAGMFDAGSDSSDGVEM